MKENIKEKTSDIDEVLEEKLDEILSLYTSSPIMLEQSDYLKSESFLSGVEKAMGIAGIFTTLVGNGISTADSIDLIALMLSAETNITIENIRKEAVINAPPQQFGIV